MIYVEAHTVVSFVTTIRFPFYNSISNTNYELLGCDSMRFIFDSNLLILFSSFGGTSVHVRDGFGRDLGYCGWEYYPCGSLSGGIGRVKEGGGGREIVGETVLTAGGEIKRSEERKKVTLKNWPNMTGSGK
jgi:hypothetical protein